MYYVIHVKSGMEEKLLNDIRTGIDDKNILEDIFCPKMLVYKNHEDKLEKCFPGYLFVKSNNPEELGKKLYFIEGYTRLLKDGNSTGYMPLSSIEVELLEHLLGNRDDHVIDKSTVEISEGKIVRVIDGPLYGFKGRVLKVNVHKRIAIVETTIASQTTTVKLSLDIIRKE